MNSMLQLKHFPKEGLDPNQIDWLDLTKAYYVGLYERFVTLEDGTVRSYKVYLPTNSSYDDDTCYMAVPDGVDTAQFLLDSGWIDLAEKEENHILLYVFEPENQKWGSAEREAEYFEKAFPDMYTARDGLRNYVHTNDFNWRWIGYGAGGEMMQRYALKNPMTFASLVVVDGSENIEQEYLDQCGDICFVNSKGYVYSEWPNSRIPVPVWLLGKENQKVVDYWKKANECTQEPLELADGYLYKQNPLSSNLMTFDQKVGQIRVTPAAPSYTDAAFTEKAYKFLHAYSRTGMNSPYGNMLYDTVEDQRFRHETIVIDGMRREWYVNVPACYHGQPMPLVVQFHGGGQTGLIAMRQGDWWKYGERKGFITVCPSGMLAPGENGACPKVSWQTGNLPAIARSWENVENRKYEERFIRAMIEKLCSEYNIDKSRMYITGQSNGGGMTQMMAELCKDLFAAGVSTGAPSNVAITPVPLMVYGGEFDMNSAGLTGDLKFYEPKVEAALRDGIAARGLDFDSFGYFKNGIFRNLVWSDSDGVPVLRFCCVTGQAHSWRQNAAHMFWDEWFCRFSKDPETGKTLYMGK